MIRLTRGGRSGMDQYKVKKSLLNPYAGIHLLIDPLTTLSGTAKSAFEATFGQSPRQHPTHDNWMT